MAISTVSPPGHGPTSSIRYAWFVRALSARAATRRMTATHQNVVAIDPDRADPSPDRGGDLRSREPGSGGVPPSVPHPCQNGRQTAVISGHSRAIGIASELDTCRLTPCLKRPSKQRVTGSNPARRATARRARPNVQSDEDQHAFDTHI